MKIFIMLIALSVLLSFSANAVGEGTYGNESYGNYSYGITSLAVNSFFNVSLGVTANTTRDIDALTSANATINILANFNASGYFLIVRYSSTPPGTDSPPATALNKYIDIVVENTLSSALNYSIIRLYYSDEEVSAANLAESTMRLYRWNGSSWNKFDGTGIGGINISGNFIFANTSEFSIWGIFGTPVPSQSASSGSSSSGGGGGGGSGFDWDCTPWSDCNPDGTQARKCTITQGIGTPSKPAETQPCTYKAAEQTPKQTENKVTTTTTTPPASKAAPAETPKPAAPAPTGFSAFTGQVISGLKKPSSIAAIIASALVLSALYLGYYYLYKKKQ